MLPGVELLQGSTPGIALQNCPSAPRAAVLGSSVSDRPYPSFIPTAQATESGSIDLISRWAWEKPAALSLSNMV